MRTCVPVCSPARQLLLRHDQVRAHLQHRHLAARRGRTQRRRCVHWCVHLWRWRQLTGRRQRRRRRCARRGCALRSQPCRLGCGRAVDGGVWDGQQWSHAARSHQAHPACTPSLRSAVQRVAHASMTATYESIRAHVSQLVAARHLCTRARAAQQQRSAAHPTAPQASRLRPGCRAGTAATRRAPAPPLAPPALLAATRSAAPRQPCVHARERHCRVIVKAL